MMDPRPPATGMKAGDEEERGPETKRRWRRARQPRDVPPVSPPGDTGDVTVRWLNFCLFYPGFRNVEKTKFSTN
jgi:hypothetical protein